MVVNVSDMTTTVVNDERVEVESVVDTFVIHISVGWYRQFCATYGTYREKNTAVLGSTVSDSVPSILVDIKHHHSNIYIGYFTWK